MIHRFLKFTCFWDEWDEDYSFRVIANNEVFEVEHQFYSYKDSFKEFAQQLIDFPKSQDQVVEFEAGKKNDKGWLDHLLIKVFCFDPAGHSAIEILSENNSEPPANYRINFNLVSEVASINRLGKALLDWDPKETEELHWQPTWRNC